MRGPDRRMIDGIAWISGVLCVLPMALAAASPGLPVAPSMGLSSAAIVSRLRPPHLPAMPYPYPRVYVYGSLPTSPSADSSAEGRPPPEALQGYLRLEVTPPETAIYVDGHFIGRGRDFSGPAVVPVSPGGHRVEFRAARFGNQVRVFVSAGETVALSQDLGPIGPETSPPAVKRWVTPSRQPAYP